MNCSLSYQHYYCFYCEKIAYYPYKTPCLKTMCAECLSSKNEVYDCKYCSMQHMKEETKVNELKREKIKLVQSATKKSLSKMGYNRIWPSIFDCTNSYYNDTTNDDLFSGSKRKKRKYNEMIINNNTKQSLLLLSSFSNNKDKANNDDDNDSNNQINLLIMKYEGNSYQNNKPNEITMGNKYINSNYKKRFKY